MSKLRFGGWQQAAAVRAHLAVGDGHEAWGWAAGTGVLWVISSLLWRSRGTQPSAAGAALKGG